MTEGSRQSFTEVETKVFRWMEQHRMVTSGDSIVLGVSGGADSMCLLAMFLRLKQRIPLSLQVVHVNHGIRPEAEQDAAYVEDFCRENRVPYRLFRGNVEELSGQWKCSSEDAGRRLRYQAFEETLREIGADRIAVAHNASDRAETMLLHLFRGSGQIGRAHV